MLGQQLQKRIDSVEQRFHNNYDRKNLKQFDKRLKRGKSKSPYCLNTY